MVLGEQQDIAWATEYVRNSISEGRIIHAAVRPTEEQVKALSRSGFMIFALPCFWPHGIIMLPCLTYGLFYTRAKGRKTIVILTDKEIIEVTQDFSAPCLGCCSSGTDSKIILYSQIASASVDKRGKGCECCYYSSLKISSTGNAASTFVVPEPAEFLRLLNDCRDQTIAMSKSPAQYSPSEAPNAGAAASSSASTSRRIFVALASAPTNFQIVNCTSDTNYSQFSDLISYKFNIAPGKFAIKLADGDISVTNLDELQNNDKVIAVPIPS